MKRVSLTSRDRRTLLLGAIIAIPALFVPFVLRPYLRALAAYRQETMDERARLAREQRIIADLPTFVATHLTASQQLERELRRLFQPSNDLVATSDLAQYVGSVAQATGVQLRQTETRPAHLVVPDLHALQLEVHAEGDLDGILHFLHQLETGDKLVRVGDLTIGVGQSMLDTSRVPGVEVLSIAANVYGYRLDGAPGPSVEARGVGAPSPFTRTAYAGTSLDAVVDHDLFNAARTRPSLSYRLAMIQREQLMQPVPPAPPVQPQREPVHFRLIGTVISAHDANFAVIQKVGAGRTPPQVVSVGKQIDDYTLSALRQGVAVLTGFDGTQRELQVDQPEFDPPLSVNGRNSVRISIQKDPAGNLRVSKHLLSRGGSGMLLNNGFERDTVYARVDGPAGWGGDTSKFLLSHDGKGHCCKNIPMTKPGTYVYRVWDGGGSLIGQGTIVMEQP